MEGIGNLTRSELRKGLADLNVSLTSAIEEIMELRPALKLNVNTVNSTFDKNGGVLDNRLSLIFVVYIWGKEHELKRMKAKCFAKKFIGVL